MKENWETVRTLGWTEKNSEIMHESKENEPTVPRTDCSCVLRLSMWCTRVCAVAILLYVRVCTLFIYPKSNPCPNISILSYIYTVESRLMCTRLLSQVFFPFGERIFQCVVEFQVIRVTRSQFTAKPFGYNVFPSRTYRVAMTTA